MSTEPKRCRRPRRAGLGLEAVGVSKRFGPVVAVDDVQLQVAEGELLAVVGPVGLRQDDVFAHRGRPRAA